MADHGTRQGYADGCRLPCCKAAQAQYRREYKARKSGVPLEAPKAGRKSKAELASVTTLPNSGSAQPEYDGPVGAAEQAVLEELSTLTSSETRKGAAQSALAMARILDNPLALAQQPSAAAKLTAILDDLRKGSSRRRGRLASVQAMTSTGTDA